MKRQSCYLSVIRHGDRTYYVIRPRRGRRLWWGGRDVDTKTLLAAMKRYGVKPPRAGIRRGSAESEHYHLHLPARPQAIDYDSASSAAIRDRRLAAEALDSSGKGDVKRLLGAGRARRARGGSGG